MYKYKYLMRLRCTKIHQPAHYTLELKWLGLEIHFFIDVFKKHSQEKMIFELFIQ